MHMHKSIIGFLIVALLVSACGAPSSSASSAAPAPIAPQTTSNPAQPSAVSTGIPEGAIKISIPEGVPTPEGTEIWAKEIGSDELLNNLATNGWMLCPEEQVTLLDEGIQILCPGKDPSLSLSQVGTIAGGLALSDSPAVPVMDAVAVVFIIVSTGIMVSQIELPRVVLLKDPRTLPDVVVPPGVVPPPDHILNHPRGEYLAKLKSLGWIAVWTAWQGAQNGGPKPDWCGKRASDGALLIVYYSAQVISSAGRIYNGFGIVVNMGGSHLSTVLTKVAPPPPGQMPTSGNSSGNDFEQFDFIPPDQCPPPPLQVVQ
jgi:hypothetical protein